jgi:hypothetical protein
MVAASSPSYLTIRQLFRRFQYIPFIDPYGLTSRYHSGEEQLQKNQAELDKEHKAAQRREWATFHLIRLARVGLAHLRITSGAT